MAVRSLCLKTRQEALSTVQGKVLKKMPRRQEKPACSRVSSRRARKVQGQGTIIVTAQAILRQSISPDRGRLRIQEEALRMVPQKAVLPMKKMTLRRLEMPEQGLREPEMRQLFLTAMKAEADREMTAPDPVSGRTRKTLS